MDVRNKCGHDGGVMMPCHPSLDNSLYFRYVIYESNLARLKDASRLTAAGGASAVPAGEGSSPLRSGGSGISLPAL